MSNPKSKDRGIADEARRASKLLERNKPVQLAPTGGGKKLLLQQNSALGVECAVLTFVTSTSQHQFTVCRPIGVTDLAENDWICLPSSEVQPALSRAKDPNAGEVNRHLQARRMEMAEANGLLVKSVSGGESAYLYPNSGKARNEQLNVARKLQKAEIAKIKNYISNIDDHRSLEWAEAHKELQEKGDVLFYLEEDDRGDEKKLQKFFRSKAVTDGEDPRHVSDYRTRVGPFSDRPQVAVKGMTGLPLHDVISSLQRMICLGEPVIPHAVTNDRGRGREKEVGKTTMVEKTLSPPRSRSAASRASQAVDPGTGETDAEAKKSVTEQMKEMLSPKKKNKSKSSEQV